MFYTWQLLQVKHIKSRPILLLGGDGMWNELLDWIKKWPLNMELMSPEDMSHITICKSIEDVIHNLDPKIRAFREKASQDPKKPL